MSDGWFKVEHLDTKRLLANWRWLHPRQSRVVARTAFGDLFLEDASGAILRLDVSMGRLERLTKSEAGFRESLANSEIFEKWFCARDEIAFAEKGLVPNEFQCIAFDIPLVFSVEVRKPYIADLYECVSFLGDLNQQISNVPDGQQVKLVVGRKPQ